MQIQRITALALLLGYFLQVPISAADPLVYQVEMLIFTHEGGSMATGGGPAQPLTGIQDAIELADNGEGQSFERLPTTELVLATAKSILDQSGDYEIVEHVAWRQPGLDENAARAVRIHGGADYHRSTAAAALPGQGYESPDFYGETSGPVTLEQLDGTVKITLSQYLHVYTDLVLRKPVVTQTVTAGAEAQPINALYQFPIAQHRRMRSKELHYLDHPLLGILVQITPIEEPPKEPGPPPTASETNAANQDPRTQDVGD